MRAIELPRCLVDLDELKEKNPKIHARIAKSHIVTLMSAGSMVYGPGVTLLLGLPETKLNLPKYFAYLYPGGIDPSEACVLKIRQNTISGEPLYLGAMNCIIQAFSSPQTHIQAVTDASIYRIMDIDSCIFKKADGKLTISMPETLLEERLPAYTSRRVQEDPGRWFAHLFARMSPDYVLGTFQNYIQVGIKIKASEVTEVIKAASRTLKLNEEELTPLIALPDDDTIDWIEILKQSPILRGWNY